MNKYWLLTLLCLSLQAHAGNGPNILIMLSDDLTWSDIGAYGADHVATPEIDALAAQGMRFTHAFTATAMCAPTRQQLYSGLFPVKSGAFPNHGVVNPGTTSMVQALRALGYRVGLSGKTHFGPMAAFPFEIVGNRPAADGGPNDVDMTAAKEFMTRDQDQPFALVLAFNESHEPWTQGDAGKFDPDTLHVPPYLADTPETRSTLAAYYAEIEYLDQQIGELTRFLDESGLDDNTLVLFTSEQGGAFPFAKWSLYDAGIRTAFIVRWPDLVPAGTTSDALVQYVDVVPTLIDAANGTPANHLDGRSFMPVLSQAKQTHREVVFGVHTNRGIIKGNNYPIRAIRDQRFKLIWNLAHENTYANIRTEVVGRDAGFRSWQSSLKPSVRNRAEQYLKRPEFEFYDLDNDPYELNNLAQDPQFASIHAELLSQLKKWMQDQGDQGLATEMQAFEHMDERIVERIRQVFGTSP